MMSYLWILLLGSLLSASAKAQEETAAPGEVTPEPKGETDADKENIATNEERPPVLSGPDYSVDPYVEAEYAVTPDPETEVPAVGDEGTVAPEAGEEGTDVPAAGDEGTVAPEAGEEGTDVPAAGDEGTVVPEAGEEGTDFPAAGDEETVAPVAGEEGVDVPAAGDKEEDAEADVHATGDGEAVVPATGAPDAGVPVAGDPETEVPAVRDPDAEVPTAGDTKAEVPAAGGADSPTEPDAAAQDPTAVPDAKDASDGQPSDNKEEEGTSSNDVTPAQEESKPDDKNVLTPDPSAADKKDDPTEVPGSEGFNLEDALKDPAQDSSSKSENGNRSGSEVHAAGTKTDVDKPETKEGSSASLTAALSSIIVAAVGAVVGYFTYQKKKLCFKNREAADPEAARKADAVEAQSDPQVLSNLLKSS